MSKSGDLKNFFACKECHKERADEQVKGVAYPKGVDAPKWLGSVVADHKSNSREKHYVSKRLDGGGANVDTVPNKGDTGKGGHDKEPR